MVALQNQYGGRKRVKTGWSPYSDNVLRLQEGRAVCLFCVREHGRIVGNECADELARRAALIKKKAADYDNFPLYMKELIRARVWKCGKSDTPREARVNTPNASFPNRTTDISGPQANGNDVPNGVNPYGTRRVRTIHRFKLKDSPYCACDPAKIQDVLHVLEECPMILRDRVALEAEIGVVVGRRNFPEILKAGINRGKFLRFCNKVVNQCTKLNTS
ncbi:hypothetical protein EVAR_50943_1 [Eumeta japonica]|uniref:Uncharacterized protein n=1 Tax=Eumeta variegata TaxID=151549 RepID=A0A4C1XE27_EUMVA|nr:hypothetical protein EVAR_50943_1 [Eumeta japonica]